MPRPTYESIAEQWRTAGGDITVAHVDRPPVIVVSLPPGTSLTQTEPPTKNVANLLWSIGMASTKAPLFRGLALDRLAHVLDTGCDVAPTTATLFASPYADKCLEYGPLIEIFDGGKLTSTWREVDANIDPSQLESVAKEYPTKLLSADGQKMWLSRLPGDDKRIASQYEIEYARWIPGDPKDALAALVILATCDQFDSTTGIVRDAIETTKGRS